MTRKSFIGTIAGAVAAILNLPKKANAVAKAIDVSDIPSPPVSSGYPRGSTNYVQSFTGMEDPIVRVDPDGKIYRKIKGEWVHVATAMKESGRRA